MLPVARKDVLPTTLKSDLFVYILSIGLQVQNKSICQSSFYVEREICDKQSKSKTDAKALTAHERVIRFLEKSETDLGISGNCDSV